MSEGHTAEARSHDREVLRESGVHKLLIADHDGNCLAYLLAWDSFEYDPETDTYVCVVDRDGQELMTLYSEGEVKPEPGTNRYLVTAPTAELGLVTRDLAI
jgi:hypothetical protein